jgi:hypothetical protein
MFERPHQILQGRIDIRVALLGQIHPMLHYAARSKPD